MTKAIKKSELHDYAMMAAEYSRDALLVTDNEDRVLWLNREFEEMTGFSLNDMLGKSPADFLRHEATDDDIAALIDEALKYRRPIDVEVQYRSKNGDLFWMESRITPIFDQDGRHTHFMSSSRDVTQRREMSTASREAAEKERLRQRERRLLSQISEWLYSSKSLEELLRVISRSLETLMPEAAGQLYIYANSRNVLDLKIHWGGATATPEHMDADDCWALRRGRAYSYGLRPIEFPCSHVTADSDADPYFCIPITAHGQTNGLLHLQFDAITGDREERAQFKAFLEHRWELALLCGEQISLAIANVQLRQELLDQSVRDPLTNLWNRRWFLDAAYKHKSHAQRTEEAFSLIALDVDHFKKFNDTYGHDAGDMVLRTFGAKMIEFFSDKCAPCRMGGEEFMVLCKGLSERQTLILAEDFRSQVAEISIKHSGTTLPPITVSAGVSIWPRDGEEISELVNAVDMALYRAKERGRNMVVSADTLKR
ncbi:MAG: diguanylate cyclase [Litoreibacter sp.]|nr:diguanylate cyclase [Litoreibacter sp.]